MNKVSKSGGTNFLNDYEEVLYWTSSKASKTLESSYMKDCYPFVVDIKNKVIFANDLINQISVPSVCVIRKF